MSSKGAAAADGKKKKKQVVVSESESEASSSASESSSSEEERRPVKKKAAPAKKPAPKKKAVSSSEESSSESDSESSSSSSESDAPARKKKPAAKKAAPKKKAKAVSSSSESDSESDSDGYTKSKAKKKGAGGKKAAPAPAAKKPAKAAPSKPANAFAGLDDEEDEEVSDASESSSESESEAQSESESESEEEEKKKPAAKPAAKGKGKGKGAKEQKGAQDDDLDDILNDLNLGPASAAPASSGPVDESKMTKAQLKRLRQKQRQEAEKAAGITPAAAAPKKEEKKKEEKKKEEAPAKTGRPNKAVEALREKLRLQKEEEERRRKEEEERAAAEEAERLRLEEEERKAEEERLRKQEERRKAREQARAEGKLLTRAEKAAQAKRQAFLKQLEASGAVLPAAVTGEAAPEAEAAKPSGTRVSKKDIRKGKSVHGKRMQAQQEADRIRAERHAAEDKAKKELKEEQERRKAEDAAVEEKYRAAIQKIDDAEAALEDEERAAAEEPLDDPEEAEDEVVADSWEDAFEDSEDEAEKEKEKEAKRAAKIAEREEKARQREERRKQLAKQRDEATRARDAEIAELRKKRTAADEARKKREEEERKAEQEKQRQAEAVAKGFEIEAPQADASVASPAASSGKARKGAGDLRSPIVCILGHVDTGKTKILDRIRQSSVGAHEAGGITQQMGCTFMPRANILDKTVELQKLIGKEVKMNLPGLLVIDTPGHESFTNLRSRGNNLCDIGILVVDITAGLEQQTIESINLLKQRRTPFIIALNKIDRCYGWKAQPNAPFQQTLKAQSDNTQSEFEKRKNEAITMLAQQGLNTVPYYENTDFRKWISIVPTSAMTGEGIPDLLMLLVQLTQNMMNERLSYVSSLSCTVLEVKVVEGLGTTIDVILVNGTLKEGDTIVVCGLTGPIVTTVRALLTPPPMQEIRVKSEYVHHKVVKAAMGVKICATGLETAVAGSSLLVCGPKDDIEDLKDEVQGDLATILSKVDHSGQGVAVQASTLGSLEALLAFLEEMKVPVSSINIGPVYKRDIMKCAAMLEKKPEYAILLAFDVKVSPDAHKCAEEMGVQIFSADVIYHLFDKCQKYMEETKERKRQESAHTAVFPVVLDILPNSIFNTKSPIVLGVRVVEGIARIGTPICIPSKDNLYIGRITGIQKNHVDQQQAKRGEEFACKIEQGKGEQQIVYGRHFDASNQLVSKISRESIDLLKQNFKDDLTEADWKLVIKLKRVFDIL